MSHPLFLTALAISSPQEKATSLPSEVAPDLHGLEAQLRRHEELEHELRGAGQQVSQSGCLSPPSPPFRPLPPVPPLGPLSFVYLFFWVSCALPGPPTGPTGHGRAWLEEGSVGWAGPSVSRRT